MTVLRVPAALLAWVLAELVRDVLGALGAILYAIGRATFRLLWIPTVVLIVYAIVVRATVRVAMPPVVWLVLTGVWLAAVVLWVIGGVFRYVVLPRPVAYIRAGPRTGPVSAERIEEWESAWRRALRYQQTTSRRADCRDQPVSNTRRHEAGSAAAGSPYEILGVGRDVTQEQLRAAYRELAMRVHPDRNPGFVAEATERFAAIPPTSCCLTRDAEPRAISGSADADAVDRLDRSRYWLTEPFVGDSADRSTCGR